MKVSLILPTLLLGFAAASPVLEERATNNYAAVVADIAAIKSQLATLTNDVNSYTANDIPGSIQITIDSTSLENDITKATNDTNNSAKFGSTGSGAVATAVLGLQAPIKASLNAIIKKKSAFQQGIFGFPLTPIVLFQLQTLKSDTDSFGQALEAKLSKAFASAAPAIIKSIDAEFNKAIVAYGGSAS